MDKLTLTEMYTADYECVVRSAWRQHWSSMTPFSCIGSPKQDCLMILLDGYTAEYTLADGTRISAPDGSLIYTATGSEYKVTFYDAPGPKSDRLHTTSVRFGLFRQGVPFRLAEDIAVYPANASLRALFERVYRQQLHRHPISAEGKSILYAIFTELGKQNSQPKNSRHKNFAIIEEGLAYLNDHYDEDITVAELAKKCYISAAWFRQLFREYTGMTPAAYKIEMRLTRACHELQYTALSVRQIAEGVGYDDISLFIRHFRQKYGTTPLQYRLNCPTPPPSLL